MNAKKTNVSSEASIEKQSIRTMANAFPNVYTISDSDDETTVQMDVEWATPLSDPSP